MKPHRNSPAIKRDLGKDELAGMLQDFLQDGAAFFWMIGSEVYYEGDWEAFAREFEESEVDFLATHVRDRFDDPKWCWWTSLGLPDGVIEKPELLRAFLPLCRFSRAAAEAVLLGFGDGWRGHLELLVPTLIEHAGLEIEEIGGKGVFAPVERWNKWYDERTWSSREPVAYITGKMHFPVPRLTNGMSSRRIMTEMPKDFVPKMLYVSPVGAFAKDLLPETLRVFNEAGADCLLLQYDDADLNIPEWVEVIREPGMKWNLAKRNLPPEKTNDYDYIFLWDDDLDVTSFDPRAFCEVMERNMLAVAQPALNSPHKLSHEITQARLCPPPLRVGEDQLPIKGRMTNFVEAMAPVYSKLAWQEMFTYITAENESGWGYDYVPFARRGIIDAWPVIHTREVQSYNELALSEERRFLADQGLCKYSHQQIGWIFGDKKKGCQ